jgi:hypothetical protein
MLTEEEKDLIADQISVFALRMVFSSELTEKEIHANMDDFYKFFCGALEAAKRDGRNEALITTLN